MLDLTNRRFTNLRAAWPAGRRKSAGQVKTVWQCFCDCGKPALVDAGNLTSNHTKSCGCRGKNIRKDITGKTFGRLTAQWPCGKHGRSTIWLCSCSCGNLKPLPIGRLMNGGVQSCGCYAKELRLTRSTTHGHAGHSSKRTSEYRSYHAAKNRCTNPDATVYKDYGGRGIKFLLPDFPEFLDFLGPKPTPQHSLDRFPNNDGHYELHNVRWATKKQQANNRRVARKRQTCLQ